MDADWDDGPLCEFDDDHFDYHSKCECGHAAIDHEGCPCKCIIRYCFECECRQYRESGETRLNLHE
ncbi:hypothetical protein HOT82_gp134 [Gordonia phage Ronaldo]|uniref:Uncharacterized protein n=2 Tax=Ronaldovirus ronaldo TaxID=2734270 RepID=A0A6B9LKW9_9CAUD|nr:hypothetical protein HOT82_gp134 [Gordonia phage Ronaldo]AXN53708.1 hypothetical protein SEA_RONALDO_141 [Gordonia phage Ronaldo]QHB38269.1 hypothetical protein SEA_VOLT_144 [Gordonia phage Volt]